MKPRILQRMHHIVALNNPMKIVERMFIGMTVCCSVFKWYLCVKIPRTVLNCQRILCQPVQIDHANEEKTERFTFITLHAIRIPTLQHCIETVNTPMVSPTG